MERAHLEGARLHKAHLEHARLRAARLKHADLENAHLEEAHLQYAQMDDANLVKASMAGAELDRASLKGAHLAGVKGDPALTPEQKAAAHCLPETIDSKKARADCEQARAELPREHPCAKYWHWGRTLDEPAAPDVPPVAGTDTQAEQPSRREPEPTTATAPRPPSTPT